VNAEKPDETSEKEETQPVEKPVVRKGPRPRGLAKFKPVKVESEKIEESEMS